MEFVGEVAALMPLQIICDMIGVPDSDQSLIFDWSNRLVGFQDPDFRTSEEDGQLAAAEIYAYCDALVEDRHRGVPPVGSSIQNFRRTVTRDVEIRCQKIAEGDKVVLFYYSANRDEEVFEDPQRFDVRRSPNDHVTFGGGGTHFCLGANLARLEIKSMIRELLQRYPRAELTGPVRRMRSDFINGIKEMPVQFTA